MQISKTKCLVLFIFFLAVFARFYRLPETMQFLGDQGRDALTVQRMLLEHHPALIGPVTSVGNMYLGPFYYYFMLFPLMLTYPDPTGPAYAVALVGVVTVVLVYYLGRKLIGEKGAIIASLLYAISPLILSFSRFSWNPNIVPFFSLLFFWHLYQAVKGRDRAWVFLGLWFSILLQLHYLTLILGGVAGVFWIYLLITQIRAHRLRKSFVLSTFASFLIVLISLIPLVAFDFRHNFTNLKAFLAFFSSSTGGHFTTATSLWGRFVSNLDIFIRGFINLFTWMVTPSLRFLGSGLLLVGLFFLATKRRKAYPGIALLLVSLLLSALGLSLYKGTLYDYYFAFLWPLVALALGALLSLLWEYRVTKLLVVGLMAVMFWRAWQYFPGTVDLGYNIFMMRRTAEAIQTHLAPGETYDILVFTDTNDYQGMNYRYFLNTSSNKPATEEQIQEFKTLFILDEQNHANPVDGPQYKIAMWPNRKVVDHFDIPGGPRVFELKR